ncbi:hypothetical protein BJ508DRAFT_418514 [Ascobolus immersus RN42]|uniref:Uncharacterized protein n=1 Tax=Ascobolus immersus RN42 TaxID=1160509 RepID=A0A3N4HY95_ASCIM|nr:hypothetical protein BJ508DRAFT_418514 [Ascobolus immersus RN42]
MLVNIISPSAKLALKSAPIATALSKSFSTSPARLEADETTPKPNIAREKKFYARGDRPTRRVFKADNADISYWDPTKNLSLTQAIDRNIHFVHPVGIYNSQGEIIGVKRANLIRARSTDIKDPETGDYYTVTVEVERFSPERELEHGWVPDRHKENDKPLEQREKEKNEREERRKAIVKRRLALWDSEFKDPEASTLLKTVRDAADAVHQQVASHLEKKPDPQDKEFSDLLEKATQLRLEHSRTLDQIREKMEMRKRLLGELYSKLETAVQTKGATGPIRAEIARIKSEYPVQRPQDRFMNPKKAAQADKRKVLE